MVIKINWEIELAKQLKKRDNIPLFGAVLGNVISISPLKITIFDNKVILDNSHCHICSAIYNLLAIGDKVLCLPTSNGQKYFIIDKVV